MMSASYLSAYRTRLALGAATYLLLAVGLFADPVRANTELVPGGGMDFRTPAGGENCVSMARTDCWFRRNNDTGLFEPANRVPNITDTAAVVRGLPAELPASMTLTTNFLMLSWGPGPFGLYEIPGSITQRGSANLDSFGIADGTYTLVTGTLNVADVSLVGFWPNGFKVPSPLAPDLYTPPVGYFVQDGGRHEAGSLWLGGLTPTDESVPYMGVDGHYHLRGGTLVTARIDGGEGSWDSSLRIDGGFLDTKLITGIDRVAVGSEAARAGELFMTRGTLSGLGQLEIGVDGGRGTVVLNNTPLQAQALVVGVDASDEAHSTFTYSTSLAHEANFDEAVVGRGTGAGGWFTLSNATARIAGHLDVGDGAPGTLQLQSDGYLHAGSVTLGDKATAFLGSAPIVAGAFRAEAGSHIVTSGSVRVSGAHGLDSDGDIEIPNGGVLMVDHDLGLGGTTSLGQNAQLEAAHIDLRPGAILSAVGAATVVGTFDHGGEVQGNATGELLFQGGTVRGTGSFSGRVAFADGYAPGAGPYGANGGERSPVSFGGGDVRFLDGSVLTLEIAGAFPGEYDSLIDIQTLSFNGRLHLEFLDGYMPEPGDHFELFAFQHLIGSLDESRVTVSGLDRARLDFSSLALEGALGVSAVPLPAAWGLMMAGFLAVAAGRHRS